jgi:hypothetical protein
MAVPIYEENRMGEEDADFILEIYWMILKPLHGLAESGLKRFCVYWACRNSHEAEAEKEIMGEDYEATDKVPFSRRDPLFPHWIRKKSQGRKKSQNYDMYEQQCLFQSSSIWRKQHFGEEMKCYMLMRRRTSTILPPSYVGHIAGYENMCTIVL